MVFTPVDDPLGRSKFPSGMAATARYLHGQGLELGLYTTSGNFTCAGQQNFGGARHRGSRDHQREDAELWIREWGVTYIKVGSVVRSTDLHVPENVGARVVGV
jgi:hypothetical protein